MHFKCKQLARTGCFEGSGAMPFGSASASAASLLPKRDPDPDPDPDPQQVRLSHKTAHLVGEAALGRCAGALDERHHPVVLQTIQK